MYRCVECGNVFENGGQKKGSEKVGVFRGVAAYQEYSVCPVCDGNYEEVMPCEICGSYNHRADEKYCEECKENVKTRFSSFIENNFTEEERKLLNELYDGETI